MMRDPAERNGYLRYFYREWRPTRFGRIWSGAWAWVTGLGLMPGILLTLQVKDRSSGRLRATVLVVARYRGQRYLVSMLGDSSEWVRNVRAAGGRAFIKRGRSHPVTLAEIPLRSAHQSSRHGAKLPQVAVSMSQSRTKHRSPPPKQSRATTPFFASTVLAEPPSIFWVLKGRYDAKRSLHRRHFPSVSALG